VTEEERPPAFRIYTAKDFHHLLGWEVQRATRYQDFLAVCLMQPDPQESVGPKALLAVARRTAEILRSTDVVGLIDDVVGILLVHTAESDATAIMERLRSRLETETFQIGPGQAVVTPVVSLGLASFPTDATAEGALLAKAQKRLTEARQSAPRPPGHPC